MKERKVAVCILLSIITCGIYAIYWMYTISEDMVMIDDKYAMKGSKEVVLTCVTLGIYGIYWAYKVGNSLYVEGKKRNIKTYSEPIRCVVLFVLGVIVSLALMQSDINNLSQNRCF